MYSKQTQDEIMDLFKNEPEIAKKLLSGDDVAVRDLIVDNKIEPEEILQANEEGKMNELVEKAKYLFRKKELYKVMLQEFFNNTDEKIK